MDSKIVSLMRGEYEIIGKVKVLHIKDSIFGAVMEEDPTKEVLVEKLPMLINLGGIGDWRSHIGWAKVIHDTETGKSTIEISLDEESSKQLGNMVEAFDLKAIGFAGIQKSPLVTYPREST